MDFKRRICVQLECACNDWKYIIFLRFILDCSNSFPTSPYIIKTHPSPFWDSHLKNIETKISRALGMLTYAKRYVPISTLNNMYKAIVQPHFNYCCSVWGPCGTTRQKELQKLQNRAARIVTNSALDSSAAHLIHELGWPSIGKLVHRETSSMAYKFPPPPMSEQQASHWIS